MSRSLFKKLQLVGWRFNTRQLNTSQFLSAQDASVSSSSQPPSWLFVNRGVAGEYGAQVNLDLELDDRLSGARLQKLKSDLSLRGTCLQIDQLVQEFNKLRSIEKRIDLLTAEKLKILSEVKLLKESMPENQDAASQEMLKKLAEIKKMISETENTCDLEHNVLISALQLPNDLHPSTPSEKDLIVREDPGKIATGATTTPSHVEIARKFDLVKFSNVGPKIYYLKGELVSAELSLVDLACGYLESHNFRQMAGPEFFKTPIIEACGLDIHNHKEVLTMLSPFKGQVEPQNHLTGVTLPTFIGFVAKTSLGDNIMPFQMFSCGRCYQDSTLPGLLGASQSTQATFLSCIKQEDLDIQFQQNLDLLWNFWKCFGFPLRMLNICSRHLRREERRRIDLQVLLPSLQQFVTVAHVSDLSDFVSRRLMIMHNLNHTDIRSAKLVHMVSGTLVNITSLLSVWMEYSYRTSDDEFSLLPLKTTEESR